MEQIRKIFDAEEYSTLERAVGAYKKQLSEKMDELDQYRTHLKVSEALMQEVRFEKEKLRHEQNLCDAVLIRLREVSGGLDG